MGFSKFNNRERKVRLYKRNYIVPYGKHKIQESTNIPINFKKEDAAYLMSELDKDNKKITKIYNVKILLSKWILNKNIKRDDILLLKREYHDKLEENIDEDDDNIDIGNVIKTLNKKIKNNCNKEKVCPEIDRVRIISRHFKGLLKDMYIDQELYKRYYRDTKYIKREIKDLENVIEVLFDMDFSDKIKNRKKKRGHIALINIKEKIKDKKTFENDNIVNKRMVLKSMIEILK